MNLFAIKGKDHTCVINLDNIVEIYPSSYDGVHKLRYAGVSGTFYTEMPDLDSLNSTFNKIIRLANKGEQ